MIDLKPWRRRPIAVAVVLVSLVAALLLGLAGSGAQLAGAVRVAAGESYTVTSPVVVAASPRIVLERGTITLTSGAGASRLYRLFALLTGRRADFALEDAEFTIDAVPRAASESGGTPASAAGAVAIPLLASFAGLDFHSVSLARTAVVVRMANGTAERFEDIAADLVHDAGAEMTGSGKLVYRGETLAFEGAVSPPAVGAEETPVPVHATVKGEHAALQFAGHITPGDRLEIKAPTAELTIASVRRAAHWLGETWPEGRGLGAFTATGSMLLNPSILSFDKARFVLDGNEAAGTLTLRLDRPRTALQGTLAFETLNLEPYAADPGAKPAASTAPATPWMTSFRLPGMGAHSLAREVDADLRISAKAVALSPGTSLGHCAASLAIKDGKLLGEIAELELDQGGSGEGQLTADMTAEPPLYKLRAELRNVDLGKALAQRFETLPLEGAGSLNLDLDGAGRTGDALFASLSGKIGIELPDGGRIAFDPDAMAEVANRAPAASGTVPVAGAGWAKVVGSVSSVDRLAAALALDRGVLRADHIEAIMGDRALSAAGTLSLAEQQLDMVVSVLPAGEPAATGRERAPLSAYRLFGPLSAPAVSAVTRPGKAAAPISAPTVQGALGAPG